MLVFLLVSDDSSSFYAITATEISNLNFGECQEERKLDHLYQHHTFRKGWGEKRGKRHFQDRKDFLNRKDFLDRTRIIEIAMNCHKSKKPKKIFAVVYQLYVNEYNVHAFHKYQLKWKPLNAITVTCLSCFLPPHSLFVSFLLQLAISRFFSTSAPLMPICLCLSISILRRLQLFYFVYHLVKYHSRHAYELRV